MQYCLRSSFTSHDQVDYEVTTSLNVSMCINATPGGVEAVMILMKMVWWWCSVWPGSLRYDWFIQLQSSNWLVVTVSLHSLVHSDTCFNGTCLRGVQHTSVPSCYQGASPVKPIVHWIFHKDELSRDWSLSTVSLIPLDNTHSSRISRQWPEMSHYVLLRWLTGQSWSHCTLGYIYDLYRS